MRHLHYTLYREESEYVAQCLGYDVSSCGSTEKEALANLKEALELYFEDLPESVIIPHPRKDIPIGTLHSMIHQSSLPSEHFD